MDAKYGVEVRVRSANDCSEEARYIGRVGIKELQDVIDSFRNHPTETEIGEEDSMKFLCAQWVIDEYHAYFEIVVS